MLPGQLWNCRILLHNIEGPVNLGAIARAMANTGFERLYWTGELDADHPEARKFAVHAKPLLEANHHQANFQELIQDSDILFGFSPRTPWPDGRNIGIDRFLTEFSKSLFQGKQLGLLFGNEAHGLENEHLAHCHYRVSLPTSDGYTSMNLSQAVLVVIWEIRRFLQPSEVMSPAPDGIDSQARAILLENLRKFVDAMDFLNPQNPDHLWQELLAIFQTREWSPREAQILNGLFAKGKARYLALKKKES